MQPTRTNNNSIPNKISLYERIILSDPQRAYLFLTQKGYKLKSDLNTIKQGLMDFASINDKNKALILKEIHPDYSLIIKSDKFIEKNKKSFKAEGDAPSTDTPSEENKFFGFEKQSVKNVLTGAGLVFGVIVLIKALK